MKPPALAEALIAAAAPSHDYDIVAGDLHEEYLHIVNSRGEVAADRWYWAQALRSIPSLLSYSRTDRSTLRWVRVAFIALAVLIALFAVIASIDLLYEYVFPNTPRAPDWVWMCINYGAAAASGATLAWLVRSDGVRITFYASVFLVLCFVIPAVAGHPGSQAPLSSWIALLAVVPTMCVGAALYQIAARKKPA